MMGPCQCSTKLQFQDTISVVPHQSTRKEERSPQFEAQKKYQAPSSGLVARMCGHLQGPCAATIKELGGRGKNCQEDATRRGVPPVQPTVDTPTTEALVTPSLLLSCGPWKMQEEEGARERDKV
ncbi:hypothetical protein NDU88_006601 [Pleurodeles waltl]|uniref:Uncharacterized protein n=1 Tax=Pleurodeles waltl TaxID=8319 RepID=A0AAV7PLW2_PLEWA|nr:hypothetical protein NDU88_006601 [Pleurodeles waltl]